MTDFSDKDACPSPPMRPPAKAFVSERLGHWSPAEHDRFLLGMAKFPLGPWSAIAEIVRTRSVRQVHSHAQKYAAKVVRHQQGLGKKPRQSTRRSGGEAGSIHTACGHRIEPTIAGTFSNSVAHCRSVGSPDDVRRQLWEDRSSRDVAPTAAEDCSPRAAASQGRPVATTQESRAWSLACHYVKPAETERPPSPSCVDGLATLFRDSDVLLPRPSFDDADTSDSLPSLNESLDFFIRQFDAPFPTGTPELYMLDSSAWRGCSA